MYAPLVDQAVVLCAGRGSRLASLPFQGPKAMLPVMDRPLIAHIVEKLLEGTGLKQVVLVVGEDGRSVEKYFRSNHRVQFARQPAPDGTADALCSAAAYLDTRFLLTYGDLWIDSDEYMGICSLESDQQLQRLAVNYTQVPSGAAVYVKDNRICRVVEKPRWNGAADTCWNASGMYLINKDICEDCKQIARSARGEFELTDAIQHAIDQGTAFGTYVMSRPQIDLGIPDRYWSLCERLSKAPERPSEVTSDGG